MRRAIYISLSVALLTISINACNILPTEPGSGILNVQSTPEGAEIWLEWELTEEYTPHTFTLDEHSWLEVWLRLRGYFPYEDFVILKLGETATINAQFVPVTPEIITYGHSQLLLEVGLDGFDPVEIYESPPRFSRIEWSPSGQYIAFSTPSGYTILRRDSSVEAEINLGRWASDLRWSNDGTVLVNGKYVDGIYSYDINTGVLSKILDTQGFTYDHCPAFSPDDSRIAYVHHEYGTSAWIRLMNPDGSNPHAVSSQFTTEHDERLELQWISDSQLIFGADRNTLYLLDVDTGNMEALIDEGVRKVRVSPDRTRYALYMDYSIYLGIVGDWSPTPSNCPGGKMSWAQDGSALAVSRSKAIYWVTFEGNAYRVVDFEHEKGAYAYGVSVKPK